MNLYKKKTASGNAWDSLKNEICSTLGLKKKNDNEIAKIIKNNPKIKISINSKTSQFRFKCWY